MPGATNEKPSAERLLNLLTLLSERSGHLTLKQIRSELRGQYPDDDAAARARFERDKADLRRLGVEIEVVTLGGDTAGEGAYSIDQRGHELADVGLTPDEEHAIHVALATVRLGASAGDEAMWKLGGERALGADVARIELPLEQRLLEPLARGVFERRILTFDYFGEGRTVEPHGILARAGFWYLVGHDRVRDARRVFRLDRIEGDVAVGEEADVFERPVGLDLAAIVPTEYDMLAAGDGEETEAEVLVDAALANQVEAELGETAVRERRADGSIVVVVPCANRDAFRTWLLAMVEKAEVLGPPAIREHVIDWLRGIAS